MNAQDAHDVLELYLSKKRRVQPVPTEIQKVFFIEIMLRNQTIGGQDTMEGEHLEWFLIIPWFFQAKNLEALLDPRVYFS